MITLAYRQRLRSRRIVLLRGAQALRTDAAGVLRDDPETGTVGRATAGEIRQCAHRVEEEIHRIDALLGEPGGAGEDRGGRIAPRIGRAARSS